MSDNIFRTNITVSEFDEIALEEGYTPLTKIHKYTLSNGVMEVDILDFGATITAIRVPDRDGKLADVVLGYDCMEGYMATKNNPYFGATVGRVCNRIANGKFTLDKVNYVLSRNEGDNTLHGGVIGFNRKLWKACVDIEGLIMHLTSPHLDEGFPGLVNVKARFILTRSNILVIRYTATTDRPTIINMTNHSYFNLAGHDSGAEKLYEHSLSINANNFTPADDNNIPIGKIQDVLDTVLDFTSSKNVGEAIEKTEEANGFDINFCVNKLSENNFVACLEHPGSGRRMVVHSNQPGVQLYTGNCVEVKDGKGKGGASYSRHAALCLETQNYPNAVNEKHFPPCILRPPDTYTHIVSFEFSTFDELPPPAPEVDGGESVTQSGGDPTDVDIQQPTSQDRNSSIKPEKKECLRTADPKTDPVECFTREIFPDFTLGVKYPDRSLEYEPMSSVFPNERMRSTMIPFQNELKHCKEIVRSFKTSKILNTKYLKNPKYNIVTDTNISPTWGQQNESSTRIV